MSERRHQSAQNALFGSTSRAGGVPDAGVSDLLRAVESDWIADVLCAWNPEENRWEHGLPLFVRLEQTDLAVSANPSGLAFWLGTAPEESSERADLPTEFDELQSRLAAAWNDGVRWVHFLPLALIIGAQVVAARLESNGTIRLRLELDDGAVLTFRAHRDAGESELEATLVPSLPTESAFA